jgi:hypothetical protein
VGFVVDKVAVGPVSPRVLRFSPVSLIPPLLHYTGKGKKLIIFTTGLHNKPQGCGASIAPATGYFTKKREREKREKKKEKKRKKRKKRWTF